MSLGLSVIVIGKNESKKLPVMIRSLDRLKQNCILDTDFVYVDSASSDNSVEIARSFFDQVIVLKNSPDLCAAAGRNIGTINARKQWALYLDGDMELCDEFIDALPMLINSTETKCGYMGLYEHVYNDGSVRKDGYGWRNNFDCKGETFVRHFGGAVLLPRELVLQAGNYNPGVFSNEEIDLYSRIRAIEGKVKFVNIKMIKHHTYHFPKLSILMGFIWPTKFLGKKFFGFGQLLASRFYNRQLSSLIRYYPYPFVYWGALIFSSILIFFKQTLLSSFILTAMGMYIIQRKGAGFLILYPGLISQAILGWHKYNRKFKPQIMFKYSKNKEAVFGLAPITCLVAIFFKALFLEVT